jgi:CRP-like cAMP-binding protein
MTLRYSHGREARKLSATIEEALYLRESLHEADKPPNILSHLTPSEYKSALSRSTLKVYAPGDMIFCQGQRHDGIFLIDSGMARTFYASPAGREITLAYWTRGNFVGGPEIFGGGAHIWSAVAVQESKIFFLKGAELKTLVKCLPNLALGVIEGLVHKGRCYSELLQILGTRSAKGRLAHLLMTLATRYGIESDSGLIIERRYTHDELANMIGSTRQWVTKMLDSLAKRGSIKRQGPYIVITNIEELGKTVD